MSRLTLGPIFLSVGIGALVSAACSTPSKVSMATTTPPPSGTFPCPSYRPVSPAIDTTKYFSGTAHMVVIPAQLVFDSCKLASIIDPSNNVQSTATPSESNPDVEERARTMSLEAHFMEPAMCPHQRATDDPHQSDTEFADEHEWGCGPYPSPSPTAPSISFPALSYTCNVPTSRPTPGKEEGMHPPIGKAQLLYDLCLAAWDLSNASLGYSVNGSSPDPNVLASPNDGTIAWELRYARLFNETELYLVCSSGRPSPPPYDSDPDFTKNRLYGCGPYHIVINPLGPRPTLTPRPRRTLTPRTKV